MSWACVLHRIFPSERVASITSKKQFSASMINDSTELVVIDWSSYMMQSDLARTLLQGGWLVLGVKHEQPKCVWNNSPFYITTNTVPDFGKEVETSNDELLCTKHNRCRGQPQELTNGSMNTQWTVWFGQQTR
jgi:hypothetical protein